MTAPVVVLGIDGQASGVIARSARERVTVAAWRYGVGLFLATGDPSLLDALAGQSVGGVELASDPSVVEAAARAGVL